MIELLLLRGVERVLGPAEVGARVDPPRVEPQTKKLVTYVVVVPDRLAVEASRVPDPVAQNASGTVTGVGRSGKGFGDAQDLPRLAFDIEILLDVVPCELAHRRMDERGKDLRPVDLHVHAWRRGLAEAAAVP